MQEHSIESFALNHKERGKKRPLFHYFHQIPTPIMLELKSKFNSTIHSIKKQEQFVKTTPNPQKSKL